MRQTNFLLPMSFIFIWCVFQNSRYSLDSSWIQSFQTNILGNKSPHSQTWYWRLSGRYIWPFPKLGIWYIYILVPRVFLESPCDGGWYIYRLISTRGNKQRIGPDRRFFRSNKRFLVKGQVEWSEKEKMKLVSVAQITIVTISCSFQNGSGSEQTCPLSYFVTSSPAKEKKTRKI
jgi:hypothetical protein